MNCVLDTHPLVYFIYQPKKLGVKSLKIISDEHNKLLIPTMVLMEYQYLIEIRKIEGSLSDCLHTIHKYQNLDILSFSMSELSEAVDIPSTKDPFDRIILASAMAHGLPIITKDSWIKENYSETIW